MNATAAARLPPCVPTSCGTETPAAELPAAITMRARLCAQLEYRLLRGARRLAGEQVPQLRRGEVPRQPAVARDGDRRGLLGHDDHQRVGLLGQADRGTMACSERAVLERGL